MAKNKLVTVAELQVNSAVKAADTLAKAIGVTASETRNASTDTDNLTKKFDDQLESVDDLQRQLGNLLEKYKHAPQLVDKLSGSIGKMASSVSKVESAQSQMEKRKRQGFYKKEGAADKQEIEATIKTAEKQSVIQDKVDKQYSELRRRRRQNEAEEKAVAWIRSVKEKHAHDKQIIAIDKNTNDQIKAGQRDLVTFMRSNAYQKVDTFQPSELRTAKGRRIPSQEKAGELSEDFWDSSGEGRLAPTKQNFEDAHNRKQDEKERDEARKAAAARQKTAEILETQKRERIRRRVNEVHRNNEAERKSEEGRQRTESILGIQRKERTGRIVAHEKTKDTVRQIREELEARKSANNQVTKTIDLIGELTAARASESATIEGNASALKKLEDQEKALLDWDAKAVGLTKQKTAQLNKIRTEKNKYTKSTADLVKEQEKENLAKDKGVKILSKFEKALDKWNH